MTDFKKHSIPMEMFDLAIKQTEIIRVRDEMEDRIKFFRNLCIVLLVVLAVVTLLSVMLAIRFMLSETPALRDTWII